MSSPSSCPPACCVGSGGCQSSPIRERLPVHEPPTVHASGPPMRLHHIGHAVADLPAAAASYQGRFGYRAISLPVHDPLQTAVVQFFQLGDDPVLLELVTPDRPDSRLSASVRSGGGLHHLCYTAVSLEAAISWLSESGMRLISDPKPAIAFDGRRICWLLGRDRSLVELVERLGDEDPCCPSAPLPQPGARAR